MEELFNYKEHEYRRSKAQASFATPEDYLALIDVALDARDLKWARELHEKYLMKEKYKQIKESWRK